ncbi:MAG: M6 family metalloprotease domain-containing protein [Paludibacter sp.]|nr:M6 family metalloprotease domain-containing protein [Paludibacter sp.]
MNRKNLLLVLFAILYLTSVQNLYAIRAYKEPVEITQPDGTKLTIRIHGDEFKNYRTTQDGYMVKQNAKGFYTYANVDLQGNVTESNIVAKNISKRTVSEQTFLRSVLKAEDIMISNQSLPTKSRTLAPASGEQVIQRAYPLNGTPKALIILVNFSDISYGTYPLQTPQEAFADLLNKENYSANGGTGSARDYFKSASYGKFSPQFDVVGPYTLPNTSSFYGANGTDGYDVKPQQMVIDACNAADIAGLNFAQYDTDNDGFVDNVFVYYAGYNEAEGGATTTIWPHAWSLPNTSTKFDGKTVYNYACTSELRGNTGANMCGIGTFTHEFGHVIGLPDYYHTTESSKNTLNEWSIMDNGAYLNLGRTPPTYSAYDRFYLGWFTPQQVSTPSDLTLLPLYQGTTIPANTNQQSYLLSATNHNLVGSNPSPVEFFMVEYRKKTGWDAFLPAEGMLIWHIDYNATAWNNNTPNNYTGTTQTASSHMRVYLQPLSGQTTTPGTAFTTGAFTPTTWAGVNINRPITSIVKTADNVTFKLMGGAPLDPSAPQFKMGLIESSLQFAATKVNATKIKTFNIKTTDLTGNLSLLVTGTNASYFIVSTASITKELANTNGGTNITVTYSPAAIGAHAATLTISGGGLNPAKVINLSGESF